METFLVEMLLPKIKEVFGNRLFSHSNTKKSIVIDIEKMIERAQEEIQVELDKVMLSFPLNTDEQRAISEFKNKIEIDEKILPQIEGMFKKDNDFVSAFNDLDVKGKSFGKIFQTELKKYKTGANKVLLMKEKDLLVKEISNFIISMNNLIIKKYEISQKELNEENTPYKSIVSRIDNLLIEIINRICIE